MIVVAAAIVRDGLVLAAHRTGPPTGWEFPGGKCEAGESEQQALAREIAEELGVRVEIGAFVAQCREPAITLRLYLARLVDTAPTRSTDHDRLCWLTGAELDGLDWLPMDTGLLAPLRRHL